ncbi:hypothetical protein TrRE_jg6718 [Triparma retinervis]|uniref:Uncharacterized protein n=1 Tax=Triparma retinervis TaxID=2557542 RepID=A0A9W7FW43_9STRA|nr:hypothetical protein TrRE_jg6718 [Triparma retinervis]
MVCFLFLNYLCISIVQEIDAKRKSKKQKALFVDLLTGGKISSMDKIIVLTFTGCFLRLVWYILIIPGRNSSVVWGGNVLEGILLKIPQILWMGAFFFMASTWMMLAEQASTMKKSNPKAQAALDFKVNMINVFLVFVVVPVYLVGSAGGVTFLNVLVNLVQMLIIIFLISSAPIFGFRLANELGADNALGALIKQCCVRSMACAFLMILGLVLNLFGFTQGSAFMTFVFWMLVHGPEILITHTLLLTKLKQRAKVIKQAQGSGATTTVAPDG